MRRRPQVYKALIKRAKGLEVARTACFAALQAVRRTLDHLVGAASPPVEITLRYQEACLRCKIAFPSRTAWACHASRVHAYRTSSTLLAGGCDKPVCRACGKMYASIGRLKRHLSASSACRRGWGAFCPAPVLLEEMHPEAPPDYVQGSWSPRAEALDPAKVHPGLLCELQGLESPFSELVWDVVVEYVEPLSMLKDTLVAQAKPRKRFFRSRVMPRSSSILNCGVRISGPPRTLQCRLLHAHRCPVMSQVSFPL